MPAKAKKVAPVKQIELMKGGVHGFANVLKEISKNRCDLGANVAAILVPWALLRGSEDKDNQLQIRSVTSSHVKQIMDSIRSSGFIASSTVLARRRLVTATPEECDQIGQIYGASWIQPDGKSYFVYDLFDGNHRFQAGLGLIAANEPNWLRSTTVNCIPYSENTPASLCSEYASRINDIQHLAKASSYFDTLMFVDTHCTAQIVEYFESAQFQEITNARARKTALVAFKKEVVSGLRDALLGTLHASKSVARISEADIKKVEEKFSVPHVYMLTRITAWLRKSGMYILASIQNMDIEALALQRRDVLTKRGIEELSWSWIPTQKNIVNWGWPATTRGNAALSRYVQLVHPNARAKNDEDLSADEKQVVFESLVAMFVTFFATKTFSSNDQIQDTGAIVAGIFLYLRSPAGCEARTRFFSDLRTIRRMQIESRASEASMIATYDVDDCALHAVFQVFLVRICLRLVLLLYYQPFRNLDMQTWHSNALARCRTTSK